MNMKKMKTLQLNLFSVPFIYHESFLPLHLALKIKEYLLNISDRVASNHGAIIGGGISMHDPSALTDVIEDITCSVGGCAEFRGNINKCVENYASVLGTVQPTLTGSWFNIQHKGSVLARHLHWDLHTKSQISGALYINVEEGESSISFENPNPLAMVLNNKNNKNFQNIGFKPQIGDLMLFPSWLTHSIIEPIKNDNRIVISFNVNGG